MKGINFTIKVDGQIVRLARDNQGALQLVITLNDWNVFTTQRGTQLAQLTAVERADAYGNSHMLKIDGKKDPASGNYLGDAILGNGRLFDTSVRAQQPVQNGYLQPQQAFAPAQ